MVKPREATIINPPDTPKSHNVPEKSLMNFTEQTYDEKPEMTAENIIAYAKAKTSLLIEGQVSRKVYKERKSICFSCPNRAESPDDPFGYCTSCGCGRNPKARLTVKLNMPKVSCPIDKWGESKGVQRNPINRMKLWLGKKLIGIPND